MNAAARTKLGLTVQELTPSLPAMVRRKFARIARVAVTGKEADPIVEFGLAARPAALWSLDYLSLANGQHGIIVTEEDAPPEEQAQSPASQRSRNKVKKTRSKPAPLYRPLTARKPPLRGAGPAAQLSPDELRAFEALGRKVRKLWREKQQSAQEARKAEKPAPHKAANADAAGEDQRLKDLISAFDAVLFLDEDFRVLRIAGNPRRLDWRRSDLKARPLASLFALSEHPIVAGMVKRLDRASVRTCRETLLAIGTAGAAAPCRATLGRWANGDATYFVTLVMLKLPLRLKRFSPQVFSIPDGSRLAA
jgi:hypothetical protein